MVQRKSPKRIPSELEYIATERKTRHTQQYNGEAGSCRCLHHQSSPQHTVTLQRPGRFAAVSCMASIFKPQLFFARPCFRFCFLVLVARSWFLCFTLVALFFCVGCLLIQHVRKCVSANVHVKALLSKLAAELASAGVEEGKRATTINLQAARNIHKVVRKLEVMVKNAHIRIEEPGRELLDNTGAATGPPVPAVAFGVCLRSVSLGLDERAGVQAGGGSGGERWFGKKFRAMETALLGNFCETALILC